MPQRKGNSASIAMRLYLRGESAYSSEEEDNFRVDCGNYHQGADDLSAIHVNQECDEDESLPGINTAIGIPVKVKLNAF